MAPRILPFSFGDSPIFAGQSAQVSCFVVEGDSPLDISWSFQGVDVLMRFGISTTKVGKKASMMVIDSASFHHQGNYTCTATNPAGVSTYAASLQVHGSRSHQLACVLPMLIDLRRLQDRSHSNTYFVYFKKTILNIKYLN